jgi:hypothetical protein
VLELTATLPCGTTYRVGHSCRTISLSLFRVTSRARFRSPGWDGQRHQHRKCREWKASQNAWHGYDTTSIVDWIGRDVMVVRSKAFDVTFIVGLPNTST